MLLSPGGFGQAAKRISLSVLGHRTGGRKSQSHLDPEKVLRPLNGQARLHPGSEAQGWSEESGSGKTG